MTVDEIFESISRRMLDGIMLHSDMVDYYRFVSLDGYAKCHELHMIMESKSYRKLRKHYLNCYDKLIHDEEIPRESVIPEGWYKHTRQDVDAATVKSAVKDGLEKWVEHETETKRFYEEMAKELRELGEIKSALYVEELVCDVSRELAKAKKYHLNKMHSDYNVASIIAEQKQTCEKYKAKIREKYGEQL